MAHQTFVNGVEVATLDVADRGLAYGDGLFETMRVVAGKIPLLPWHLQRFSTGVARLGLGEPEVLQGQFRSAVSQALAQCSGAALVKVMVTRGLGGAGYMPPKAAHCTFIAQVRDLPSYPLSYFASGVNVALCRYRLMRHPRLAGIKHLNRLDQVLASQELKGEQEGLLFDQEGLLVEGIKSNVLIFEEDKVLTPRLDWCGVRGTLRQYLIDHARDLGFEIAEAAIDQARLREAEGVAMINSIFGIWPVVELGGRCLASHPNCTTIKNLLVSKLGYS